MKRLSFDELWEETSYLKFIESRKTFDAIIQCPLCKIAGRKTHILDYITSNFVLCGNCKELLKIKIERDLIKEILEFWMNAINLFMNFYKKGG